jgi:UDP-glucuronate decarboxylase
VIVVDNMFTGRKKNVAHWIGHPNFSLVIHDVVEPILLEVSDVASTPLLSLPP